jgi:steroid delta-isomerase-like uncharacterized protein
MDSNGCCGTPVKSASQNLKGRTSMSEQNKELVRRFFEDMCNGRQLALADQLFAPGHVYHDPSSSWVGTGPAGMRDLIGTYHRGVSDARWEVQAMLVAGDVVVTRWTGRGTHSGDLRGLAPSGRRVSVDGIWMHRIAAGKIVESWNCWDMLGLLQQIGAVPKAA